MRDVYKRQVFDWVYRLLRYGHETQMQESAAQQVRELEAAREALERSSGT